jgi:hypothetical protein
MPQRTAVPPLAHSRAGTVFLLLGCQADRQTLVADLLSGRCRHPLRVVAFDTEDGGIRDVSAEIAREILKRAAELDHECPLRCTFRGARGSVFQPAAPEPSLMARARSLARRGESSPWSGRYDEFRFGLAATGRKGDPR